MRDPARRERIIALIRLIWMRDECADMRLMQLLGNATRQDGDLYYYEDAKLEIDLQEVTDVLAQREVTA